MKEKSWSNESQTSSSDWRSCETYKKEASKTGVIGGMAFPFTPLSMSFNEVNYYVNIPPVSPSSLLVYEGVDEKKVTDYCLSDRRNEIDETFCFDRKLKSRGSLKIGYNY